MVEEREKWHQVILEQYLPCFGISFLIWLPFLIVALSFLLNRMPPWDELRSVLPPEFEQVAPIVILAKIPLNQLIWDIFPWLYLIVVFSGCLFTFIIMIHNPSDSPNYNPDQNLQLRDIPFLLFALTLGLASWILPPLTLMFIQINPFVVLTISVFHFIALGISWEFAYLSPTGMDGALISIGIIGIGMGIYLWIYSSVVAAITAQGCILFVFGMPFLYIIFAFFGRSFAEGITDEQQNISNIAGSLIFSILIYGVLFWLYMGGWRSLA
ncbi:MAG: hypothetical protein DWQ04_32505 [Chloroflexi bacterium]|nr:MAG: hypothetical protein DWQ04_32505 [Chloroflexota bacterium]